MRTGEEVRNVDSSAGIHNGWLFPWRNELCEASSLRCVIKGMFIPKLKGQGATGDAIALLGALVMP